MEFARGAMEMGMSPYDFINSHLAQQLGELLHCPTEQWQDIQVDIGLPWSRLHWHQEAGLKTPDKRDSDLVVRTISFEPGVLRAAIFWAQENDLASGAAIGQLIEKSLHQ
jgi:hypothetical protein